MDVRDAGRHGVVMSVQAWGRLRRMRPMQKYQRSVNCSILKTPLRDARHLLRNETQHGQAGRCNGSKCDVTSAAYFSAAADLDARARQK